jgi:D-glycero-alpha-D-manno-heptose-7-phosphate kinase
MIIRSRAPLRIGLAGGGSDVSPFCDIHGGQVINAAINKYAYCSIDTSRDTNIRFISHDTRRIGYIHPEHNNLDEYRTDVALPLHSAVYDYFVQNGYLNRDRMFDLQTWTDVPYGSGLGASSAIVVAMISAFDRLLLTDFSPRRMAEIAIKIEREILRLPGGKQDQCSAVFGGRMNHLKFANNQFEVKRLPIPEKVISELEMSMILCYSHPFRDSETVMSEQIERVKNLDEKSIFATKKLVEYVSEMRTALINGDIGLISVIINRSYLEKAKIATKVVTSQIAKMRFDFMNGGVNGNPSASAVKICGAGNGGFLLLIIDPLYKKKIQKIRPYDGYLWMEFQFVHHGVQSWKL